MEKIAPCADLSNHDIRTAIRNSTGPRPSLFVPEIAFDLLIKPQIKLLEPPSLKCVEMVYEELMKICHSCGSKVRRTGREKRLNSAPQTKEMLWCREKRRSGHPLKCNGSNTYFAPDSISGTAPLSSASCKDGRSGV